MKDKNFESRIKELEEKVSEQQEEIERLRSEKKEVFESGSTKISRRQFLKKAGLGAAGLGALSLSPTMANLKLTKNSIKGASDISTDLYVDAGEYSSLQSAIDDLSNRDARVLRVPPITYDEDITIDEGGIEIIGSAGNFGRGTQIDGTVTVNTKRVKIKRIRIFPGDTSSGVVGLQINSPNVIVNECNFAYADKHIVIDSEHCMAVNNFIAADNTGTVDIELTSNSFQNLVQGNVNWSNNSSSISTDDNGSQNSLSNNI